MEFTVGNNIETYVTFFIIGGILLWLIIVFIKSLIDEHKRKKQLLEELEQPYCDPQLFEYKATVIEKYCQVENHGSVKMPQTRSAYYLTFKTYDGRILKYNVLEADYLQIEENQTGTLAVVNDKFYGFCPE